MILSVHNPTRGGFDYYQAPDQNAINDDMPTPRYPSALVSALGVPASMAGRPLPAGAVLKGHGDLPKGSISTGQPGLWTGTKKSNLPSGLGEYISSGSVKPELAVGLGLFGLAALLAYHDVSKNAHKRGMTASHWAIVGAFAAAFVVIPLVKNSGIQEAEV